MNNSLLVNKVISSEPATIVFWKDGTKTKTVKDANDTKHKYDLQLGIYICAVKKFYPNLDLNKFIWGEDVSNERAMYMLKSILSLSKITVQHPDFPFFSKDVLISKEASVKNCDVEVNKK